MGNDFAGWKGDKNKGYLAIYEVELHDGPNRTGRKYQRGVDYEYSYRTGCVTRLTEGAILPGATRYLR